MQTNYSVPEKSQSEPLPIAAKEEEEKKSTILSSLKETATAVHTFFGEKISEIESILKGVREKEEETLDVVAKVYDPDFILARKCSWAVKAYQKVFEKWSVTGSPGPGNGYFETVQLLLEQVDLVVTRLQLNKALDRSEYFTFLEFMFPKIPRLTRCHYPGILYFIALRIKEQKDSSNLSKKGQLDFWMVSISPSKELHTAALLLLGNCHNMFNLLRFGKEEDIEVIFSEFEKGWHYFYRMLKRESVEYNYNWCPDICINVIMSYLSECRKYPPKIETALRLARHFDEHSKDVLRAIEKYPLRCSNTYINNRAYTIASLVMDLSSTTLDTMAGAFVREVKILEI